MGIPRVCNPEFGLLIDLLNRSFKSINVLRCAFVGK